MTMREEQSRAAQVAANRARYSEIVREMKGITDKGIAGKATAADEKRFNELEAEAEAMRRFPDPEAPAGALTGFGFEHEDRSVGPHAPLKERTWKELTSRSGSEYGWGEFRDGAEFLAAVASGRFDPRLNRRANNTVTEAGGGFAVPAPLLGQIFDAGLASEAIRPRARIYPMTSNTLSVACWADTDHSANVFGGFTSEWVSETGAFTVQTPTLRKVAFQSKKLGLFSRVSNELAEDSPSFSTALVEAMQRASSFFLDSALIAGDGASEPEGVLNAPCLIAVTPESGQAASTIVTENIVNMWARLLPGSHRNATWFVSPSSIPALMTLTLAVGTGGGEFSAGVLRDDGRGNLSMMGRPVVVSEHMPALGAQGDVLLADLSFYGVALRADARIDIDQSKYFDSDEAAVRLKIRLDAKSMLSEAITPANGDTLSPFVAISART